MYLLLRLVRLSSTSGTIATGIVSLGMPPFVPYSPIDEAKCKFIAVLWVKCVNTTFVASFKINADADSRSFSVGHLHHLTRYRPCIKSHSSDRSHRNPQPSPIHDQHIIRAANIAIFTMDQHFTFGLHIQFDLNWNAFLFCFGQNTCCIRPAVLRQSLLRISVRAGHLILQLACAYLDGS